MSLLHALILGIVQGFTEFLPVSSSGHLALVPWLFGWDDFGGDQSLENAFDVALHLGTLVGVIAYLRDDIRRYGVALLSSAAGRPHDISEARVGGLLLVTAVPTGLIGVLVLSSTADLGDRTWLVAVCLIGFGLLLGAADRRPGDRDPDSLRVRDALVLGLAQGLAFQPGVSRSGATLTAARVLGLERVSAARLVFLMSVPVIAGAGLLSAFDVRVPSDWLPAFAVGTLTAAVGGWFAVHGMLRLLSHRGVGVFVVYRVLAGLAVLSVLAVR
ncbi:MAG: undecaprenyl-diphosphate phosphatase [Actinomycetia bacterium]|jgi:undecaprenyl-diphosphatase|nr:undecaprenyl-diphosphate phosphatase [Actinomycetes bacterium]